MLKQAVKWTSRLVIAALLLGTAFLAGRWNARTPGVLDSADSGELQRALGYYRWSIEIPPEFDGGMKDSTFGRQGDAQSFGVESGLGKGNHVLRFAEMEKRLD